MAQDRTVEQVVNELSGDERKLLEKVLQIERDKLHQPNPDVIDELVAAVKGVLP